MNVKFKIPENVKLKTFLGTIAIAVLVFASVLTYVMSQPYVGDVSEVWVQPPFDDHTYICGLYNTTFFYAQNSSTGEYEWLSSNDDTVLQNAIDATNASGGGSVYVKSGTYSASVTVKTNVLLILEAGVSGVTYTTQTSSYCIRYASGYAWFEHPVNMTGHEIKSGAFHTGTVAPSNPSVGQWWYDTSSYNLKIYNGTDWATVQGEQGPAGEAGTLEGKQPYAYLVFQNSTAVYMVNGTTGQVDWSHEDAGTLITNALGNSSGQGEVYVTAGEYTIYAPVRMMDGNIALVGAGENVTILKMHDRVETTLQEDAASGTNELNLTDPTHWYPNMYIRVNNTGGQTDRIPITSVSGNVVTLAWNLGHDYQTGDFCFSVGNTLERTRHGDTDVSNLRIEHLTIDGNKESHHKYINYWLIQSCAQIQRAFSTTINHVTFKNGRREGLELTSCPDSLVTDSKAINCGWDGIALNKGTDVDLDPYGRRTIVSRCTATGCGDLGFRVTMLNTEVIFSECISYNNNGTQGDNDSTHGFSVEGLQGVHAKCIIDSCIAVDNHKYYDATGAGVYVQTYGGELIISNCYFCNNSQGVYLNYESGKKCTGTHIITGCIFRDNQQSINSEANDITISDNMMINTWNWTYSYPAHIYIQKSNERIYNINIHDNELFNVGIAGETGTGILIKNCTNVRIHDNLITDNRTSKYQVYGINFEYDNTDVSIKNNDVRQGGTTANIGNLNTISGLLDVEGNWGFVTENSGTQTCADNENIPHGLAGTPNVIWVTPMNDTYDGVPIIVTVDWSNVDSTNIKVGLYWVNGTAITADVILVSWRAEYKP